MWFLQGTGVSTAEQRHRSGRSLVSKKDPNLNVINTKRLDFGGSLCTVLFFSKWNTLQKAITCPARNRLHFCPLLFHEKSKERMNSWEGYAFPLKKCFIFVSFLPDISNCDKLLERRKRQIKTFLFAWQPAQPLHAGHSTSQDLHLPRPDPALASDSPKWEETGDSSPR